MDTKRERTPCALRTATVTPEGYVLNFELHREAHSRTCHWTQGRDRQQRRGSHDSFDPAACFNRYRSRQRFLPVVFLW